MPVTKRFIAEEPAAFQNPPDAYCKYCQENQMTYRAVDDSVSIYLTSHTSRKGVRKECAGSHKKVGG